MRYDQAGSTATPFCPGDPGTHGPVVADSAAAASGRRVRRGLSAGRHPRRSLCCRGHCSDCLL
ncbi:MAG: 2Fe-2S iron-sulfur cluster-binding protein [Arthrobacter sp.]